MDSSAAHTSFNGGASEHDGDAIGEAIPSSSNPQMKEDT
jgi:hypothetical protein